MNTRFLIDKVEFPFGRVVPAKPILRMIMLALCLLPSSAGICQTVGEKWNGQLAEGDLLFCASRKGNQITDVTQGVDGLKIDHVAIVHFEGKKWYALEAIHKGVCLTPSDSFLVRCSDVVVARLCDTVGVSRSVYRAMVQLGKPYDFNFMPDDSAFYCSELVQKSYRDASGQLIFQPIPMSFHDKTGMVTPYWKDYYARQGLCVPEGAPGSNPGDLSRNKALCILGWLKRIKD